MRNPKVNIYKATAVFLIILAAVFYYFEQIRIPEATIETAEIIVAITDIPENTIITKEMITVEKRYVEDVLKTENIAKKYDEVVGKRSVVPLYKGEPVNIGRIIENKSYMNSKNQTQIALAINEIDKALELKADDYIDIWLEPVSQGDGGLSSGPYKLMEKMKIIKVHDSNYDDITLKTTDSISTTSNAAYVPAYITIELTDPALKELYSVDKNKNNIRITRYGKEKFFYTVKKIIGGD